MTGLEDDVAEVVHGVVEPWAELVLVTEGLDEVVVAHELALVEVVEVEVVEVDVDQGLVGTAIVTTWLQTSV